MYHPESTNVLHHRSQSLMKKITYIKIRTNIYKLNFHAVIFWINLQQAAEELSCPVLVAYKLASYDKNVLCHTVINEKWNQLV